MAGKVKLSIAGNVCNVGGFEIHTADLRSIPANAQDASAGGIKVMDESAGYIIPDANAPGGAAQYTVTVRVFRTPENDAEDVACKAYKDNTARRQAEKKATDAALVEARIKQVVQATKDGLTSGLQAVLGAQNEQAAKERQARELLAAAGIKVG